MADTKQSEAPRLADGGESGVEHKDKRTEQLMRELAAECRISAEQKLRADQLAQQHRMQREINHADGETILALRAENGQLHAAHQHTNGNVALLTDILNRRPAMNAGLVEAYAAWTAEVYNLMGVMAAAPVNDADRAMRAAQPDLNLNCKSTQKRLATLWGFVPAQSSPQQDAQAPVAWRVHPFDYGVGSEGVYAMTALTQQRDVWERRGWKTEPLYTAPQPSTANEADLWRCTVCGRIGTVGRCCGEDTRAAQEGKSDD